MSDVEWRDIPGFEGAYQVSNDGQVRSLDRVTEMELYGQVRRRRVSGRIMRLKQDRDGYKRVGLSLGGAQNVYLVHRLVAEVFIGRIPENMLVCHNNGDPSDNRVENLRFDTPTGNAADRKRHGTNTFVGGESHKMAKLTEKQVIQARHYRESGMTVPDIKKKLDLPCSLQVLWAAVNRKNWKHIP